MSTTSKTATRDVVAEDRVRQVMYQSVIIIVVASLVLLVLGVVMVYSATAPSGINIARRTGGSAFATANLQLIYAIVGVAMAGAMAFVPMRVFQAFSPFFFGAGLFLQALVITPLGRGVGGNTNWVRFGPVSLQPSEFLKLAVIVWLAAQLVKVHPRETGIKPYFLPAGAGALVGLADIMLGKDMGTAMMYVLVCVGIFWIAGMPGKYFLVAGGVGIVGAAVLVAMSESRLHRVMTYAQNLFSLPDGVSPSQSDFALWAFGSGGLGGSGLGTGAEKWPGNLAEAQTDFIFAVIGEELGFFGCLVVVVLFLVLGWALVRICRYHPSRFARLACAGVALWICGQGLANMLVVTGVFPVFGVPLPFISQGGSSVMACLMAVGVALSCAFAVPGVRESFRVRAGLVYRARALLRKD